MRNITRAIALAIITGLFLPTPAKAEFLPTPAKAEFVSSPAKAEFVPTPAKVEFVPTPAKVGRYTYTQWQYVPQKNYYLRTCTFDNGAYFYAVYKPSFSRNYIFCWNPYKQRYWCCCPTVNHPQFNVNVRLISIFILILNIDNATTLENSAIPANPVANTKPTVPLKNANGDPVETLDSMPTDLPG